MPVVPSIVVITVTRPRFAKLEAAGVLDEEDRILLTEAVSDVRSFPMRRDIVRQGERPDYAHAVVEGWACRHQVVEDGSRQITAFMIPGDPCDPHIALFGAMDHTIGALTDTRIEVLPAKE